MNTAIVLGVLAVVVLGVEIYALSRRDDDWWTITAIMRALPVWAVALIMFFVGVLVGHFWWA